MEIYDSLLGAVCDEYDRVTLIKKSERGEVTLIRHRASGNRYIFRHFSGSSEVYRKLLTVSCPNLPQIMEEYDRLAKEFIKRKKEGRGFQFFHFMIDLEGGPCVAKRLSGCGSGTEYLAVTPWGDLYPCHQFVGQEEFLMGNVDEGIVKPQIAEEFRGCSVYSKESCRKCFARYYCSGGCMANAYKFHGNINDTYEISCEMERKRVECAIMIKAALADK